METDQSSISEDSTISRHDRELLAASADGDRQALETFVRRHEQRLARIAYRILGCQSTAEDARNEVLLQLISEVHDLSRLAEPAAWLTRCIVNESLTRVRQDARERRLLSDLLPVKSKASQDSALESLLNAEACEELKLALMKLSPMQRTLVSLRFDEGMTFHEIAELLEKPPSTIKSQLAKAISLLRRTLSSIHKQPTLNTRRQRYS